MVVVVVAELVLEVVVDVAFLLVLQIRPNEPSNIPSLTAVEVYHSPQSVCAKDDAPENMMSMLVTLDTSHLEMSPLNCGAFSNMPDMVVTLDTSHLEMSPLNDDASWNMAHMEITLDTSHLEMSPLNDAAERNTPSMLITLDTSHLERSLLNDVAQWNMVHMVVTLDTSHLEMSPLNDDASNSRHISNKLFMSATAETSQDPIGPCGPSEQSKAGSFRHCSMAASSSALDFGAHPVTQLG